MTKKILVTGGAGYIGSHCVIQLLEQGYEPIIYDDLSNSSEKVLERIERITGFKPRFIKGDITNQNKLEENISDLGIYAVMHFAGKKSVSESETFPLMYYSANVGGTISLLRVMERLKIKKIIFSSTATVYGSPCQIPGGGLTENSSLSPINHYGKSKLMAEKILQAAACKSPFIDVLILRYFNPVGAHASGLIGENPKGIPANLMPYVSQVAAGVREKLYIFGGDYDTRDGTGARDYIHVEDLASAHLSALRYLEHFRGAEVFNIGTGRNVTVLELLKTFEKVNNKRIPYEITARRAGDTAICFADPSKAYQVLKWRAEKDIANMCEDSWNWQKNNPNGLS